MLRSGRRSAAALSIALLLPLAATAAEPESQVPVDVTDPAPGPTGWLSDLAQLIRALPGSVETLRAELGPAAAVEAAAPKRKPEKPSNKRRMKLVKTITGGLSPKSIVADQNGQVFAMNMMYNHTISVFDNKYRLRKTIQDSINLKKFGFGKYPSKVRGAPVEAAVSPDGKKIYVSNYTMYGPGFNDQGFDLCTPRDRIDRSFVYEIDTKTLRKTDAIRVGEVPKYLAITPDGRRMLVGNWCSWDISVVDLRKGREIKRIKAGVAPRGMAFSPNGKRAYVTLVGEHRILIIDMDRLAVKGQITGIGRRPRHLVMSPGGRYLYITVQGEDKPRRADGRILKYDIKKRKVVARSKPLIEPRTTVAADDGKSLFVVDYHPGTVVKLDARNLKQLQSKYLGYHPIGVTYDNKTNKVWVSGYGGSVWVLKDK